MKKGSSGSSDLETGGMVFLLRERLSDDQDTSPQEDVVELINRMRKLKETLTPRQMRSHRHLDGGRWYNDTRQLVELEEQDVKCLVPENRDANRQNSKATQEYQAACDACPAKKDGCPDTMKQGRNVSRSFHTETLKTITERVASGEGAEMKRARYIACEGAFARIKNQLHWKRCSMWGKAGAQSELAWRVHPDVLAGCPSLKAKLPVW